MWHYAGVVAGEGPDRVISTGAAVDSLWSSSQAPDRDDGECGFDLTPFVARPRQAGVA